MCLWTNSAKSGGRLKSGSDAYFGGITGGTEKVISACAADKKFKKSALSPGI